MCANSVASVGVSPGVSVTTVSISHLFCSLYNASWNDNNTFRQFEALPYTRSLERVPSPAFGDGSGVYEHRLVATVVLDRSEWSAKRSRSEREADHGRRSVDMCNE